MRLKKQEITSREEIDEIIKNSIVCRLALSENNQPYIVPLCFGYDGKDLYFHSAGDGKKIDILKQNNKVCFEFEADCEVEKSGKACDWGIKYKSVIGFGKAIFLDDIEEKKNALNLIVKQYSSEKLELPETAVKHVTVMKVSIDSITGKFGT